MKKFLCALLSLVIMATLISGCGEPEIQSDLFNPDLKLEDTGGLKLPLADGTQKIVWSVEANDAELNDSYVVKKLREATGVNLELMVLPLATAGEKIKVLAASKKLPDIVGEGLEPEFANDLSVQGAFAAVEDYLDIVPNFKRTFVDNKENNWIFKTYAAPDGKLYGFYGWDWSREVNTGAVLYRKDIFDKNGIKMWDSPEGFYQALKKLKEIYPSSTPYTSKSGDLIFASWARSWRNGMVAQDMFYDEADKTWYFTDVQPEYKEMLDFMSKCYREGLIDPEFITNTQATWTSKMTQAEKAFVTTDWIGRLDAFKEQTKDTVPDYDLRFGNPVGPSQTMPTASQLCWARHVSNNDNKETSFKMLDFVLSPAGKAIITMGIEGETYTIGEDGMAQYIDFPDKVPSSSELQEKYGMFVQGMYLSFDRRSSYFNFTEREQEAQDYAKDPKHMSPRDPELVFTTEQKASNNEITPNLQKAAKEFSVKYILNNGGDKEWNEWLKNAERLGYKTLEKTYNDAQKAYDKM